MMENTKKKKMIKEIIIMVCCYSFALILGILSHSAYNQYKDYKESSAYLEKVYIKEPTTNNLIKLCYYCLNTGDIKYLDYIDTLLTAEDYEEAMIEFFKDKDVTDDFKEGNIGSKTFFSAYSLALCAINNDIEKFLMRMEYCYSNYNYIFYSDEFHLIMSANITPFFIENKYIIVEKMHALALESSPSIRMVNLINVLAFYKVTDKYSPQIGIIKDELNETYKEFEDPKAWEENSKDTCQVFMAYWVDLLS